MEKKKLLVLTPRFPYPVVGGDRLRIYYICKKLSVSYDITLLSFCESQEELNMSLPDDRVFSRVERVFLPKWISYLNVIRHLFSSTPLQVAYYKSRLFSNQVDRLIKDQDVALAHLVRVSNYLKGRSIPCVLEMTDAISMNYERVKKIASSSGLKNLIYAFEQKRLKKYEKSVVTNFDLSVLISDVDKYYLFDKETAEKSNVVVCGNGVDFHKYRFSDVKSTNRLVFIGNMNTVQNFDAAYWFATKVLPRLNKEDSFFKFEVIGRISEANEKRLSVLNDVYVVGSVDSVSDYAEGALAGVCSMRLGAGVQNKVLEYMALGLPSVISPIAAEGLRGRDGEHFFIANSVEEYLRIINGLNKDAELASKVAISARKLIESEYAWGNILSEYQRHIDILLS